MVGADYNDKYYDYTKYWEGRDYENMAEISALKKILPRDFSAERSVIDVGGGFGRLLGLYKKHFGKITIFDYSEKLLIAAQENAKNLGIEIDTVCGDINNISNLVDGKYDYVCMIRVSHHLEDLDKVFGEVYKILNSGGVFILEIANKMHFKSVLVNLFRRNWGFFNREPVSKTTSDTTFLNHHPKKVEELLEKNGFRVTKILSVSNFRMPLIKKAVPYKLLIWLENITQRIFAPVYFGPSIFYKIIRN